MLQIGIPTVPILLIPKTVKRINLREQENKVKTWAEFVAIYKTPIEGLEIQLERGENYKNYKKLADTWKDLGIESWFLVREILHRKRCLLIENDFPPVGLPYGVKVYTFWINKFELSNTDKNMVNYKKLLKEELQKHGYDIDDCIFYMRDEAQMSIPQYPHFHVYCPPKITVTSPSPSP
jgi:hypothetical protein